MNEPSPWVTNYIPLASTIAVAAATITLAILTGWYVRVTSKILDETRRSREPMVSLDFEMPDQVLRLVVANYGLTPAKDVRIEVLRDATWLRRTGGSRLVAETTPVRHGISHLTPGRTLKYRLGMPDWDQVKAGDVTISLRLTYADSANKQYESLISFDFTQMTDVLLESFRDSNLTVADAIREAERSRQTHERMRQTVDGLTAGQMKRCSACDEPIRVAARKCPHCYELQEPPEPEGETA